MSEGESLCPAVILNANFTVNISSGCTRHAMSFSARSSFRHPSRYSLNAHTVSPRGEIFHHRHDMSDGILLCMNTIQIRVNSHFMFLNARDMLCLSCPISGPSIDMVTTPTTHPSVWKSAYRRFQIHFSSRRGDLRDLTKSIICNLEMKQGIVKSHPERGQTHETTQSVSFGSQGCVRGLNLTSTSAHGMSVD